MAWAETSGRRFRSSDHDIARFRGRADLVLGGVSPTGQERFGICHGADASPYPATRAALSRLLLPTFIGERP